MGKAKDLQQFARETGFGGVAYVHGGTTTGRKVFWTAVLLGCCLGLVAQTVLAVRNFIYAMPATSLTILPVKILKLPDVVICLPIRFDQSRVHAMNISNSLSDYLQMGFISGSIPSNTGRKIHEQIPDSLESALLSGMAEHQKYQKSNPIDFVDLVDKLSFECEDIFYKNSYFHIAPVKACKLARKLWTSHGLCFEFNGTEQFLGGAGQGMVHRLELPRKRYQSAPNINFNDGVSVMLSTNGEIEADFALAPSGSRTQINIDVTHGVYLPTRKNPCDQDPVISPKACIGDCVANSILSDCECISVDVIEMLKVPGNRPICSTDEVMACMMKRKIDFKDFDALSLRLKNCSQTCPTSCEMWSYRKQVSSYRGSSELLASYTSEEEAAKWGSDTVILDIYYGALQITEITQFYTATIPDLFGVIGGLLGLWLGGSIIAFVHLICFWIM